MGIDDGLHLFRPKVLLVEFVRGCTGLHRSKRINDDDTLVSFDDGGVGQIQTSYLIDTVGDFEQTIDGGELGLAPKTWIGRFGTVCFG